MGQEISDSQFTKSDFSEFAHRLTLETRLLQEWFNNRGLSQQDEVGGFELEAWLVDRDCQPAPVNDVFLAKLNDELAVPELARFNVEFNLPHQSLIGPFLRQLHKSLQSIWARSTETAKDMDAGLIMIGVLPTLAPKHLDAANMSDLVRYHALNEQVLRQRHGRPLKLDIQGHEHLSLQAQNVMLESATTSFQLHLKVTPERAGRFFNAAMIASAPMVAISANSPYFCGKDLWAETRIPLFEQSVEVGGFGGASSGPMHRVTFGTGYVRESIFEVFEENREHYPPLLPTLFDEPDGSMAHLRLHNGTIWRWTRPIIGFDDDATPHLRIEHRVVPAGPTVIDCVANAAFFFGLVQFLATQESVPEKLLPFADARDNFYNCARDGLRANVTWMDTHRGAVQELIVEKLMPMAHEGLAQLSIDEVDRKTYLAIIEARARSGQNGAFWQRQYIHNHGPDFARMTASYQALQNRGVPVHEWGPG